MPSNAQEPLTKPTSSTNPNLSKSPSQNATSNDPSQVLSFPFRLTTPPEDKSPVTSQASQHDGSEDDNSQPEQSPQRSQSHPPQLFAFSDDASASAFSRSIRHPSPSRQRGASASLESEQAGPVQFKFSFAASASAFSHAVESQNPRAASTPGSDSISGCDGVQFGSKKQAALHFDGISEKTTAAAPPSLRILHNATPLPSPLPSPRSSPQPEPPTPKNSPPLLSSSILLDVTSPSASPKRRGEDDAAVHEPAASPRPTDGSLSADLKPASTTTITTTTAAAATATRSRSLSDVSFVSEQDGAEGATVSGYNIRDERLPEHRFFTADFQNALRQGVRIAKDTAKALEKASSLFETDSSLEKLFQDAKGLSSFHASDTKNIAILGDSGEGKSSLINSLLHFPGLAKTGDIGSACTSVVTEYRQKTADHDAVITIEVDFQSQSEIEDAIKELLWSYRQLYLPTVESDRTSAEDYARYTRESAQAWSALEAAFKHHTEFREEFLKDMSDGAEEQVLDKLVQWSRQIEWPDASTDGLWRGTAANAGECGEKTGLFMQDKYWPFTKVIRIYLNAQILKTGVVLADLPGLQDTNMARVRSTLNYLMRCDNIFIVAKIMRAITDQSLKSSLFLALSQYVPLEWEESGPKNFNVAVICTRSEDINEDTAKKEFCGPGKRIDSTVMDQLEVQITQAKSSGNRALKKELKRRREWLLIEARNNHVKDGLQRAYAAKVPDGRLDIFCVSNKSYEKYSRKGNTRIVQDSGIPDLRRFCYKLTAEAQLHEARHFLQSSLFSLLNSIDMWANSASCRQVADIPVFDESAFRTACNLEDKQQSMSAAISKFASDFRSCFREQLMELSDNRHRFWESAAANEESNWETWHWTQFNAWCINNGNHSTPKRPREDWNAKIIWKMRTELEFQWELVEDEVSTAFEDILSSIECSLVNLKEAIQERSPVEFRDSLADSIQSRIESLKYKLQLVQNKFGHQVKSIRRRASESNYNSYALNEMLPTYRSASSQSGGGMSYRQKSIIRGRVTDGALFPNLLISTSRDLNSLVDETADTLRGVIEEIVKRTSADLEIALSSYRQQNRTEAPGNPETAELTRKLGKEIKALKWEVEAVGRSCA